MKTFEEKVSTAVAIFKRARQQLCWMNGEPYWLSWHESDEHAPGPYAKIVHFGWAIRREQAAKDAALVAQATKDQP